MQYLSDFFSSLLEITASFIAQRRVPEPLDPSPGYTTVGGENLIIIAFWEVGISWISCHVCWSLHRVFLHDVTTVILVYQDSPVGFELFSYVNAFFCSRKLG